MRLGNVMGFDCGFGAVGNQSRELQWTVELDKISSSELLATYIVVHEYV